METHSSILTWKIPWTEEPGRYIPWGCRVRHDEQLSVGHIYLMKVKVLVTQSCLTLCNPED